MVSECANLSSGIHGWRSISCAPEYIVFASLNIQVYLTRASLMPLCFYLFSLNRLPLRVGTESVCGTAKAVSRWQNLCKHAKIVAQKYRPFTFVYEILKFKAKKKNVLSVCCRQNTFFSIILPHPCEFSLFSVPHSLNQVRFAATPSHAIGTTGGPFTDTPHICHESFLLPRCEGEKTETQGRGFQRCATKCQECYSEAQARLTPPH